MRSLGDFERFLILVIVVAFYIQPPGALDRQDAGKPPVRACTAGW